MNLNLKMTVERLKHRSYCLLLVFITKCLIKNLLLLFIFTPLISSCNNRYCRFVHEVNCLFAGSKGGTVSLLVFGLMFLSHTSKRLCSRLQQHLMIYSLKVRLLLSCHFEIFFKVKMQTIN